MGHSQQDSGATTKGSSSKSSTGGIVGGVVGATGGIMIIVAAAHWFRRRSMKTVLINPQAMFSLKQEIPMLHVGTNALQMPPFALPARDQSLV
jgi:hypothetical protein